MLISEIKALQTPVFPLGYTSLPSPTPVRNKPIRYLPPESFRVNET
jgi:hypothetical protein